MLTYADHRRAGGPHGRPAGSDGQALPPVVELSGWSRGLAPAGPSKGGAG